jgi:chitin disaccharide deacetylase
MKLIINADDYGADSNTTRAIVEAFSRELCSSTTILATGSAYEEAIELAKDNGFYDKIGIHLNLTEGRPLTEPIRRLRNFCDENGMFGAILTERTIKPFGFTREERNAMALEINTQIEKCNRSGLSITHADSHHHVHTRWGVWQIMEPVLKTNKIYKVRISRNCGEGISIIKYIYKILYNNKLNFSNFITTNYFGCTVDVLNLFSCKSKDLRLNDSVELMIHPKYNKKGELTDLNGEKLENAVKIITGWDNSVITITEFGKPC